MSTTTKLVLRKRLPLQKEFVALPAIRVAADKRWKAKAFLFAGTLFGGAVWGYLATSGLL